ncbi:hypothetical protein GMA12_16355 [Kocuria sediminis]|uniref:Uncharacterized protein n=1 Tax=Kocuria sediminis TaxID=1038857 RepID=A0A6N8GUT9_9MICC|nr:hypothetical protein [Kocuria sediminis]MUN64695.1 hypothetical protein [Kocuria sediminis]
MVLLASPRVRRAHITRRRRGLLALGFAVLILLGPTLGYFTLHQAADALALSVLVVTGGAMISMVAGEMPTEAPIGLPARRARFCSSEDCALSAAIPAYPGI